MSDTQLQAAYAAALAAQPAQAALPRATAMAQAQEVIARASACAPEFTDVEPPLATMPETPTAPAEPTGKYGRPIIKLKKSRKLK
jgi:hypothetical protein